MASPKPYLHASIIYELSREPPAAAFYISRHSIHYKLQTTYFDMEYIDQPILKKK